MTKPKVKLVGTDGNAFHILAKCRSAWMKSGGTQEGWDLIEMQMTAGDYDNLLSVAQRFFDVE